MNDYQKAIHGQTLGYEIAKEFYYWMHLSQFEEKMQCSSIVRLAEMIDSKVKADTHENML